MTRTEIILIVLVVASLIAVVLAMSGGGPRVTQITRHRKRKGDEQ